MNYGQLLSVNRTGSSGVVGLHVDLSGLSDSAHDRPAAGRSTGESDGVQERGSIL